MRVGVFDSGLGGLTVVKSIIQILKGADIFYIADTAYAPYGEKTSQQILNRCDLIANYLLINFHIDALVVACNTATSVAIEHLREKFPFLVIVGTEPGIKPAINVTKTSKVGVMATPATLKGEKYQFLANTLSLDKKVELFECACYGLVDKIENDEIETIETFSMLEKWLTPMKNSGVDTIVLGCTHYPLIEKNIKRIMGENINIIQTGDAIAKRLLSLSSLNGHINFGDLSLMVLCTGNIKKNMVKDILRNQEYEIRECEI